MRQALKPLRLYFFPRLLSTSDHAAVLRRRRELFAPAVVLTSRQIAGRGRGSNTWWSGPGSITATFAFPINASVGPHQLPLVAGLAVRDAASELLGDQSLVNLKWPNDLLVHGRKLAGLLCERIDGADLVGVGLNVNLTPRQLPAGLRERVTSLSQLAGKTFALNDALVVLAGHLRQAVGRHGDRPFAAVLRDYNRHHWLVGRQVTITQPGEPMVRGRCEGLDSDGRLLIRDDAHRLHRVIAGHVATTE